MITHKGFEFLSGDITSLSLFLSLIVLKYKISSWRIEALIEIVCQNIQYGLDYDGRQNRPVQKLTASCVLYTDSF